MAWLPIILPLARVDMSRVKHPETKVVGPDHAQYVRLHPSDAACEIKDKLNPGVFDPNAMRSIARQQSGCRGCGDSPLDGI